MTRKDFTAIATAISVQPVNADRVHLADTIGKICAAKNPRFSQARFDVACNAKRPSA